MGRKGKLTQSVLDWRDTVVLNAENGSLIAFADATVSSSSDIDRISSWALGVSGAICGLMISNLDKLTPKYFDTFDIKVMLVTLVLSILCGVSQKYLALMCSIHLKVKEVLSLKMKEVLSTYESHENSIEDIIQKNKLNASINLDLNKVLEKYVGLFPVCVRWFVRNNVVKSASDPEFSSRSVIGKYIRQNVWLAFQAVLFISFILYAAQAL